MKNLFTSCLYCLFAVTMAIPAFGQRFPEARDRVLIGFQPGTRWDEIQAVFSSEPCLMMADERMQLPRNIFLGWMADGGQACGDDITGLLTRLNRFPQVRFANPFINAGRDLRGLTDRVVVKLKSGQTLDGISDILRRSNATVEAENEYMPRVYYLVCDKTANLSPFELVDALQANAAVEYADVDYMLNPVVTTNDSMYPYQWSIYNIGSALQGSGIADSDMDVLEAWGITMGDSAIKIAIIDCGIDTLHPDLIPNLLPGHDATGGNSNGYPNTNTPNDAHGTNCAGIVAAVADNQIGIAGICPNCRIMPVKVFYYIQIPFSDPLPYASGTAMADAINWAYQAGSADVLSNSWGLFDVLLPGLPGGTTIVEDAISQALTNGRNGKGALLFFSSGNDGGAPLWPGRLPGCFSVNATTQCDQRKYPGSCDGQNWEGNWGDSLDIGAPGVLIAATDMTGANGYEPGNYTPAFGGTSAACPNAAGVMGLVLSVAPWMDLAQAHFVMESTCDKVGGYNYQPAGPSGTWSPELGYGRLNAHQAVLAAQAITATESYTQTGTGEIHTFFQAASQEILLVSDVELKGLVKVDFVTMQGQIFHTWEMGAGMQSGQVYRLNLASKPLSDGLYFIRVSHKSGLSVNKMRIMMNN